MNTQLQKLAKLYGYAYVEDRNFTSDQVSAMVKISEEDKVMYVLFLKEGNKYYAYDLSSEYLPYEIFSDSLKEGVSINDRHSEVLTLAEELMSRQAFFYPKPSVFNRSWGYILTRINKAERKLMLKDNYFGLHTPSI